MVYTLPMKPSALPALVVLLFHCASEPEPCGRGFARADDGACVAVDEGSSDGGSGGTNADDGADGADGAAGSDGADGSDGTTGTETGDPLDPAPAAAEVQGESDCGHAAPVWLWSFAEAVDEVRVRVDSGTWEPAAGTPTGGGRAGQFQASGLGEGGHLFEIEGRFDGGEWSETTAFETVITFHNPGTGYWSGVSRAITTSPLGHFMGVACHNCYNDSAGNPADNLTDTEDLLQDAVRNDADLLEIDVKVEGGTWYVDHNEDGGTSGALVADVLALPVWQTTDAPLFLEIKERSPTQGQIASLLQMIIDAGFATNGRPVIVRTFLSRIDNLTYAQTALQDHPLHAPYFRLHLLYNRSDAGSVAAFQGLLVDAQADGFDGVELNLQTPNLFSLLHQAEALGLGTAVWTAPESMGEIYCAGLRDDVDILITDYPVDDCIEVAEEDTQILYLDVADQSATASSLSYRYDGNQTGTVSLSGRNAPTLRSAASGALLGSYLDFDASGSQSLAFHDGDNDPDEGYFVVAVFKSDAPSGTREDTQALVSKADSGGFAIEIDQSPSRVLRYGVRVDGSYAYATRSTSALSTSALHMVMGAYDGNGRVRLWLDASDSGVSESGSLSGGVDTNDSPIRIGADPEGTSSTRFFFDGQIQMISVQKWRNH